MIVAITISNSQMFYQGFLSAKHSLHFMDNEGIYSVEKNLVKHFFILPNEEFRGYLARWSFLRSTRELDRLA